MLLINGVTGAIGSSLLPILSDQDEIVSGIGRNVSEIEVLQKRFPHFYFKALNDIESEIEAHQLLTQIEAESGQSIDQYLHAAAVLNRTNSPIETSIELFRETLGTNLVGAFVWNKAVIVRMIRDGIEGSVLNIASQAARTGGFGGTTAYSASKGGLVTLTKSFSRFASQFNIRVNTLSPGFVDNKMMTSDLTEKEVEQFIQRTALKRLATNEEIANVCLFLLSKKSSYITGENYEVSAGQILG